MKVEVEIPKGKYCSYNSFNGDTELVCMCNYDQFCKFINYPEFVNLQSGGDETGSGYLKHPDCPSLKEKK